MNILPPPIVPELSSPEPQPVTEGGSLSGAGFSDNAAQASFPAVLAQANQQGPASKALSAEKDQTGDHTSLRSQGDSQSNAAIPSEGAEAAQPTVAQPNLRPGISEDIPLSSGNVLSLALETNGEGESRGRLFSQIAASSKLSARETTDLGNVETPRGLIIQSAKRSVAGALPGAGEPGTIPIVSSASGPVLKPILQSVPLPTVVDQETPPPPLMREPQGPVQIGTRGALPSVPLSFVSEALPQGQSAVDSVKTANLSATIPQNIQGPLPSSLGTVSAMGNESSGHGALSVVGQTDGDAGGSLLGSEQRSHQEHGAAFSSKQQPSGYAPFSMEPGSEFRASETSSAVRAEGMADRARALTMLSPQRLQMEVMLADETKVQVDVLVKQQQVSAQLMTDQLMLRNLALQQEPQLDAQLSSVGLELKQFGAEVSEEGVFGQYLSDSSDRTPNGSETEEIPILQEDAVLAGTGVGSEGSFHFVA